MGKIRKDVSYEDEETGILWEAEIVFTVKREWFGEDSDGNRGERRWNEEIEEIRNFTKNGYETTKREVPEFIMEIWEETELDCEDYR